MRSRSRFLKSNQRLPGAIAPPSHMPSRSLRYNPDTKIPAAIRSANALPLITDGDPVRTFSRWELDELRADLLASTLDTLRRDKLINLIDQNEVAEDYRAAITGALDAADLETLADAVTEAEDALKPRSAADKFKEILDDNPKATPAELLSYFTDAHDEVIDELRKDITDTFANLSTKIENTRAALRVLDPNA